MQTKMSTRICIFINKLYASSRLALVREMIISGGWFKWKNCSVNDTAVSKKFSLYQRRINLNSRVWFRTTLTYFMIKMAQIL